MNNDCIFELPYNHDFNFFDAYYTTHEKLAQKNIELRSIINFVYMPAYYEHSRNTREEAVTSIFMPRCICEYKRHMRLLDERLKLDKGVLFQEPGLKLPLDIIKFYEDMNVKKFIVNSDELAYSIKEYNEELTTIASVTKQLNYDDYFTRDLSMYDVSCLNFIFERGITAVQKLPKTIKYSMIINNSGCMYNCKWQKKHWYLGIKGCNFKRCENSNDDLCIIFPNDLEYFKPYIYSFKIQGRDVNIRKSFSTLVKFVLSESDEKHSSDYFNASMSEFIKEKYFDIK